MSLFVYVFSRSEISVTQLKEKLSNHCHIEYSLSDITSINNQQGSYEFLAIFSKDTIFYKDNEQFCSNNNEFIALQGYCWKKYGGESTRAIPSVELKGLLQKSLLNIRSVQNDLSGEYSTIYRSSEGKIISFNDNFGIESVFYYDDGNTFIVSNREDFVRISGSISEYNYSTLCQLPLAGSRLLDEGIYRSVKKLPPGAVLTFDPLNGVKLQSEHPVFLGKESMSFISKNRDVDNLIEAGLEEVKSNLYAVTSVVENIPLGLTGGKDSRLILAFCHAFGLDKRVESFTNGHPEHPDVKVAKKIAKLYQVRHKVQTPKYISSAIPYVSAEELFHRMSVQVFRTDSCFGVWDLKSRGKSGYGVGLGGFFGEVFKNYVKQSFEITDKTSPGDIIKQGGVFDPLDIIDNSLKEEINLKLKEKLWSFLELGYELDDIPALYHNVIRMPQWLGAARLADGYSIQSVSIINSSSLAKLALNLPAEERKLNTLHYKLIEKLSPNLLKIPFAMQTWDKKLVKYGASAEIFQPPVLADVNIPSAGSWQFLLNENPFYRKLIIDLVNENKSSQLWVFINRRKLLELLKKEIFSHFELISLYGFISAFFKESDLILPSKLGYHNSNDYHKPVSIKSSGSGKGFVLNGDKLISGALDESAVLVADRCLDIISNKDDKKTKKSKNKNNFFKRFLSLIDMSDSLTVRGRLEIQNEDKISGWVYCEEFPHAKLTLDILIDGVLNTQITADKFRKDLKQASIGDGRHAFNLELNDLNYENVEVKVSGSTYILPYNGISN